MSAANALRSCLCSVTLLVPRITSAQENNTPASLSARPSVSFAQNQQPNVPPGAKQAEASVERTVRRFRIGAEGGIGPDPELVMIGAHGAFGPIFSRSVEFRPASSSASER